MPTLAKPTAADQKATQGNTNYISVSDGSGGFVWLIDDVGAGAAVTAQSGSHAFGSTGTSLSGTFTVMFPQAFANPPTVELTYQWNYNASTNGSALSPALILDGAPSTTSFTYRINGGRNTLDRVAWTAVDPTITVDAGNTVLTERAITGSITSTGYDGVTIPYQIPLTAGQVLDTVSLNGTATTDFDASTGIVRITPNGAPITVTHTTKAGATFSALQWVGEFTPADNTVYDTLAAVTTGIDFTKCDYIEWQFRLTSDLRAISGFVPKIVGGTTPTMEVCHGTGQISSFIANATDAKAGRLTNIDCHGVAFEVIKIRGWALGLNKVVVPTATTVATTFNVTVNGGANGTFTGYEGIGPQPFILTMPQDQEIDAFPVVAGVSLLNRQAGMISVNRAIGGGNLALAGITFRAMAPNSVYFGTWENQSGDSTATNGGHTCTRRLLRGTGITTGNDSLLTLSGGIYKIRTGIVRLFGNAVWRTTSLLVDGISVESMFTGRDGGNWDGGGPMEWIVDATTVNHTVQVRRVSSSGNGNCSGFLSVERIAQSVVPDGVTARTPCNISINGGANITLFGGTSARVFVTVPNGQMINAGGVTQSAGITVGVSDPLTGALEIAVTEGTTTGTITVPFVASAARSVRFTANAGVWTTFKTLQFAMAASGNRSFQVRSAAGNLNVNIHSWTGWDAQSIPFNVASLTPSSAQYLEPSYGYTAAGNNQFFWIEDVTNGRRYEGVATVGGGYNNNTFFITDVT